MKPKNCRLLSSKNLSCHSRSRSGGVVYSLPPGVAEQSIGTRFVGRADLLRKIHLVLQEGAGGAAQLTSRLNAAGGFGKTRLAIEYMYRYGARYPGGIFWVNAASSDIEGEFWRVLSALDPDMPDLAVMRAQRRDVRRELGRALRQIGQPALYVIDNVPEAPPGSDPPPIADFCPPLAQSLSSPPPGRTRVKRTSNQSQSIFWNTTPPSCS